MTLTALPHISGLRGAILAVVIAGSTAGQVHAQTLESKPYDDKLNELAEILGAVHYLRELCGANDGQLWRDRMREILETEGGTSAARRARLTKSFNQGYRSYGRTYQSCSPTAQTAITRFLEAGARIAEQLVKSVP